MQSPRKYVHLDPSQLPAVPYRIPDAYTPPEHIQSAAARFWATPIAEGDHLLWPLTTGRPRFTVNGKPMPVWEFAYLSRIDDVWPGLVPRPRCDHELCVAPEHLHLRRRRNEPATREVLFEAFRIRQRYLEERRRAHAELDDEAGIAAAYELPLEQVSAWFGVFRTTFMIRGM